MLIEDIEHKNGTYVSVKPSESSKAKIHEFAKKLGVPNLIDQSEYHTTVLYSRQPCPEVGNEDFGLPVSAVAKKFSVFPTQEGTNALVIEFECEPINSLHNLFRSKYHATHDYPEFRPHITLSYDAGSFNPSVQMVPLTITYDSYKVKPIDKDWHKKVKKDQ